VFFKKALKLGTSVCFLTSFWLLVNWKPVWVLLGPMGFSRNQTGFHLILAAVCIWLVSVFGIVFSKEHTISNSR
jgi:hypothetical protein